MGEPKSHTPQQRRGLRHTVLHTCVSTYVNVHVCTTRRRWPEGASCSRAPGRPCVTPPGLSPSPRLETGRTPAQIHTRLSLRIPALGLKPVEKPCGQA